MSIAVNIFIFLLVDLFLAHGSKYKTFRYTVYSEQENIAAVDSQQRGSFTKKQTNSKPAVTVNKSIEHKRISQCCSLTCPAAQQRAAINVQSQVRVCVAKHHEDQTDHQHQFQQTLQDLCRNGNFFLKTKLTT